MIALKLFEAQHFLRGLDNLQCSGGEMNFYDIQNFL